MRTFNIPVLADIELALPIIVLHDEEAEDHRADLVLLWSFAVSHGAGPHHPLVLMKACRVSEVFLNTLEEAEWITRNGDEVFIRPWQEVLGYVSPAPVVSETKEDRRRRQKREWQQQFRDKQKQRLDV